MEKTFEVLPVAIKYICDVCNEGEMVYLDGKIAFSNPPQFQHKCTYCEHLQCFTKKYPTIEYKFKE